MIGVAIPTALAIAGVALTTLVTLGALVASVKAGLARGTVESQEKEIASLRRRVEALEAENARRFETMQRLEAEVRLWREAATGENVARELEALAAAIKKSREEEHATHVELSRELARVVGRPLPPPRRSPARSKR